jgi:DNA-binding XRE family transcriptional regulator
MGVRINRVLFNSMSQLPNYLRSHRKRLAFSQEDVAFLLGNQSGAKMCRYERFVREPSLEVALALAVIFRKPLEEIFAGAYRKAELKIAARAKALGYRLDRRRPGPQSTRRREALQALSALSKVTR